jgi:hypothetical protein
MNQRQKREKKTSFSSRSLERVTGRWTGKTDNRRRVHPEQGGRDGLGKGLSTTGEELDSNCKHKSGRI